MQRAINVSILLVLLLVPASGLAQKIDLSPLLGNVPSVGDTRTYAINTGGQLVLEATQVQFTGKTFRVVVRSEETGLPVSFLESFIVPGKQSLLGSSVSTPLSILVKKPKRIERFVFKLGKPQRSRVRASPFPARTRLDLQRSSRSPNFRDSRPSIRASTSFPRPFGSTGRWSWASKTPLRDARWWRPPVRFHGARWIWAEWPSRAGPSRTSMVFSSLTREPKF